MAIFSRRKDPDRPKRSAWLITAAGFIGAILFAAGAYSLYWFAMADQMRRGAESWREDFQASGGVAEWRQFAISGYPFWLNADVAEPRLGQPRAEKPWFWEAPRAAAALRPWNFRKVTLDLAGQHAFQFMLDERAVPAEGRAETLNLDLQMLPGNAWEVRLDLKGLRLNGPADIGAIAINDADILAQRLRPTGNHVAANWSLKINGNGISAPESLNLPLGRDVARLFLDAKLLGHLPPGPLNEGLPVWRDSGGTVEISRLELEWGPLAAQGDGTIALDGGLQPIGAFSAKAQGFFDVLDVLRRRGIVASRDAMTATVVLGVLSRRPAGGGPASLSLPLSIQSQTLYAGPVTVAKIPTVRWTGAMPDF